MSSEEFSAPNADVLEQTRVKEPRRYQVLLHNDDYTTMEFVVAVLMEIFHKDEEQATAIMLSVHKKGIGVAGVYPREIAETKIAQVRERAAKYGFPLRCSLREEGA